MWQHLKEKIIDGEKEQDVAFMQLVSYLNANKMNASHFHKYGTKVGETKWSIWYSGR